MLMRLAIVSGKIVLSNAATHSTKNVFNTRRSMLCNNKGILCEKEKQIN